MHSPRDIEIKQIKDYYRKRRTYGTYTIPMVDYSNPKNNYKIFSNNFLNVLAQLYLGTTVPDSVGSLYYHYTNGGALFLDATELANNILISILFFIAGVL